MLVTAEMVAWRPGSVIVDLAAERGGNCELTRPGETVVEQGVTIIGPTNLPSTIPYHASQMFAKNMTTFLLKHRWSRKASSSSTWKTRSSRDTLVTRDGDVVHQRASARQWALAPRHLDRRATRGAAKTIHLWAALMRRWN